MSEQDWSRCVLRRQSKEPMDATEGPDALVQRLEAATYRAKCVRDWANCVSHPTDEQVDTWLKDLNRLVSETDDMLDGLYLG